MQDELRRLKPKRSYGTRTKYTTRGTARIGSPAVRRSTSQTVVPVYG